MEVMCDALEEGEGGVAAQLPALVAALVGVLAAGDVECRHAALGGPGGICAIGAHSRHFAGLRAERASTS